MDLSIAGPVVGTLAFLDVVLHVVLNLKKIRSRQVSEIQEPDTSVPTAAMAAIGASTLLSFLVVFSISLVWLLSSEQVLFLWAIPLIDVPCPLWMTGLTILCVGILLHSWSRLARRNKALPGQWPRVTD